MSLPVFTDEQRKANLEKAAKVRKERAEIKARLKSGEISFEEAIVDDATQRMLVSQLVASVPGYGKVKTDNLMRDLGIRDNRRVQGLSDKQRSHLIDAILVDPSGNTPEE